MIDHAETPKALTPGWWLRMAPLGALLAAACLHLLVPQADWSGGSRAIAWAGVALAAASLAAASAGLLPAVRRHPARKAALQALTAVAGVQGVALLTGWWLAMALLPFAMAAFVLSWARGSP